MQAGGAEGIVNGMDVTEWNPKTDKYVPVKYDRNSVFEGKAAAKAALQAEAGLPVDPTAPLFGYIGRLEEQKGVDILLSVSAAAAAFCFGCVLLPEPFSYSNCCFCEPMASADVTCGQVNLIRLNARSPSLQISDSPLAFISPSSC